MSSEHSQHVLYTARTVHTLDPHSGAPATGVLARDGLIVAVGDASELRTDVPSGTAVHDLGDAVVTPGLVDGHSHPIVGLEWTDGVDLSRCLTMEDLRSALGVARTELSEGEWLRGWGLNPTVFEGVEPTYEAVGAVLEGVPAYLLVYDGHSALVNREALLLAGLAEASGASAANRGFVTDARIAVDSAGTPTGQALELEATELLTTVMPRRSLGERADQLHRLLSSMARTGLTGAHVMDAEADALEVLAEAERRGPLPLKLGLNPWVVPQRLASLDEILALQGCRGGRWRVEGVKFFLDGTIDGGTAWLEQPDCCGEGLGTSWGDEAAFASAFERMYMAGVHTATHAIGDRAVRCVTSLVASLSRQHGPRGSHRVEHIETAPDSTVSVFASRQVAASMQPLHATRFARADRSDTWSKRLGEGRAARGFRCRDLRDAGAVLALGSDWPIAPFDPRITMADAQLRRPFDDASVEPVEPSQALTALQVLEGYTTHAAQASGEAERRGMVRPGFAADLTVWSADPLTAAPTELGTLPVVGTVVDGKFSMRD